MTDTVNAGEAADDGVMPTSHADVMPNPRFLEGPPAEARETYGPGEAETRRALRERSRDHAEQEAAIRIRSLPDDAPEAFRDAKDAARWRAADYKLTRALRRNQANPDEHLWVSAHVTGQQFRDEIAAKAAGGDDVDVVELQNVPKDQTIKNEREAGDIIARYRNETKPAEQAALDERRRQFAEWDALDLIEKQGGAEQTGEAVTEAHEQPAVEPAQQHEVDPVAHARQHAEAYVQAARQYHELTSQEVLAHAQLSTAAQKHASEFSDVKSYDDLAKLSPDRQQRFVGQQQALKAAFEQFQQLGNQRQVVQFQIEHARRAEQQAAFNAYKAEQDRLVEAAVPELKEPVRRVEMTQAAEEILATVGVTRETYNGLAPDVKRALASADFQINVLTPAVKYKLAQAKAAEARAVPLPVPQRPGVARDRGDRAQADVSHLSERIDRLRPGSDKQLRAAANLIATRRANRGR